MKKKRILITGAVSLLGKYLIEELSGDYDLYGTFHNNNPDHYLKKSGCHFILLDITNIFQIKNVLTKAKPDIIIHLAAVSNIDLCEDAPSIAHKINIEGTQNLVNQCHKDMPHIIFLSSNAIFDGYKPPYSENSKPNPLNFYGKTKYFGEQFLLQSRIPATIIRSTTMYGWPPENCRDNDISYYLKQLKQVPPLHLVNDRFFNPVYVLRTAQLIKECIGHQKLGIYHIGGIGTISRYTLVKEIIKAFDIKKYPDLIPVTSDYFPDLAHRPLDATLDISKIIRLGIKPKPLFEELKLVQLELGNLK